MGAGRKSLPTHQKKEQFNVSLPPGDAIALKILIPSASERNDLIKEWVRAYLVARGKSDRLFAQSPTLLKAIRWIESQPEPDEELLDELHSLLVTRESDEMKIADGVTQVGDSLIV